MPTSAFEGRDFFTQGLIEIGGDVTEIIDFGPGEGTYAILGRHLTRARWRAVEIFGPYIERYDLLQKYEDILVHDMRSVSLEPYGLGIFGDVLEHLSRPDAMRVLYRNAGLADHLFVSVPINPAPQGPSHGNDAEAHLYDWTFEEMDSYLRTLGDVKDWRGAIVGRWWVKTYK